MLPKVHTFTHHQALVRDIGCYCWGAMQLKLGGIRSLLSAVGDRLSLCRVRGTLPNDAPHRISVQRALKARSQRGAVWSVGSYEAVHTFVRFDRSLGKLELRLVSLR